MPEGDSIRKNAAWLGPKMVGHSITSALSRWPSASFGLAGRTVERLEPQGKNLWIVLDDRTAIRIHLGMRGRWRWLEWPYRGSLAEVSLALAFAHGTALCTGAPTVQRLPVRILEAPPGDGPPAFPTRALGPDVMADDFDVELVLPRIRTSPAANLAEILLDQRVACGIGNVYKSEVLFVCGLDPFDPPGAIDDPTWRAVYATAREQMLANAGPGPRITTPASVRSPHWVYGRAGRPCLQCGSTVQIHPRRGQPEPSDGPHLSSGGPPRHTYWCPTCSRSRRGP